ncbi:hypothetical protein JTE90_013192 [Oedothorax gibbosus]|uniref:C2H2-type domain-containing protein n=1 Tax=Oedothorax gibbosus TaxID=931172 RepID=A0AAV6TYT4_9ARAC|nr:hypothetical protein JTE90_013192 [Oedothorax gibbosus]
MDVIKVYNSPAVAMQGISDVFQRHKKDFILCFKTTDEIIVDYKPDLHSREIMVKKEIVIESNETAPLEIKMCDQQENGLKTIEEKFSKHEDAKTSSSLKSNVECPMQHFSLHDESKNISIEDSLEQVHLRCHTGEKPVKCYLCDKNFANQQSFKKHMKSAMHLKKSTSAEKVELNKTFLCSICGAKFFRLQTLRRHVETIHLPGEVFKCPHCDYSTKFKANFVRHKEGHFNIKRYVCELCGASFRALGTLQEHQTFVHSDCRNFSCDTCGKAFKNKSTLQRHLRIHKDERPYKCHCNLSYKRLSHLKRHLAAAHGITPEKGLKKIAIFNKDSSSNVEPFGGVQGLTSNNAELDSQNENSSENDLPDRDEQTVPLIKSSIDKDQCDYISYKNLVNLSEESVPAIDFESSEKQLPSPSALSVMLSDTQDSITLEDHSLVASPSTYNLPASGPQKLKHSVQLDKINRPHSLPNLNFQTYSNETYFPISVDNFDISSSNPPVSILDKEEPSPAHEHLFEDITNFNPTSDSEIIESSSDIFFSVSKNSDSWNPKANRMSSAFGNFEITEDSYNKIPSTLSEFSNNFSSTYSPLLACNLVFPDDPLMECTIDADSFNTDDFVLQ